MSAHVHRDAFCPAPRYSLWPDEAHRFVATAVERGAVSALLETKLFQAHELEAQLGLGRYRDLFDAELTRDAVLDTYLRFRGDWLVLARPTAKDHAQFFCAAVRNRVISGHRRWGARRGRDRRHPRGRGHPRAGCPISQPRRRTTAPAA